MRMLVVLAAMLACAAVCHWTAWAMPASADTLWLDGDPNEPEPVPGPEMTGFQYDEDPNEPDPVPGPEVVGAMLPVRLADDEPNEPEPQPGPEIAA